MQLSICDMQKFYTKIEDRPEVREVVTTFKEHHPIEKVSRPMMHSGAWGNACGAQQSGPAHACSSQLQHCSAQLGTASAPALRHAAVSDVTALRLAGRFLGTLG